MVVSKAYVELIDFRSQHMPSIFQSQSTEERMKLMFNEKALMLRITDFLLQEHLITLEEQMKAAQLIQESETL